MSQHNNPAILSVPARLSHWAAERPDARFLAFDAVWHSYGEVDRSSDALAAGLARLGVAQGDRVLVILPNRYEIALAFFAVAKLGAIFVPVNCFLRGEFLAHQVRDCGAKVAIVDQSGHAELAAVGADIAELGDVLLVDDPADRAAGGTDPFNIHRFEEMFVAGAEYIRPPIARRDPLSILYTSGTTGKSKGCVLSHGYYLAVPECHLRSGLVRPGDTLFTAMPFFHAGTGLIYLMNALQAGIALAIVGQFSARSFFAQAREVEATVVLAVGAMGNALLALPASEGDTDHAIRDMWIAPFPPERQIEFERRFGVHVISGNYGQTEVAPVAIMQDRTNIEAKRGTVGKACGNLDIRIVDEDDHPVPVGEIGEVIVRPLSPDVMFQGYWRNPQATVDATRNLWFHTGDLGRFDEEGYLTFAGRKTDSLRRRGENVSAFEVEQAMLRHVGVQNVAVYSVPSSMTEDEIMAAIVTVAGISIDPLDFFGFLKAELPYFAIPRYVEIMAELPLTAATGRVQKADLRSRGAASAWDFEAMGLRVERSERRAG